MYDYFLYKLWTKCFIASSSLPPSMVGAGIFKMGEIHSLAEVSVMEEVDVMKCNEAG